MSSKLTWKLNGVDLDDGSLGLIVEPSMWRPPVAARLTNVLIPGQHGDIMPGLPVFDAPLITLSVWRASTQTNIEAATNALLTLLAQPSLTLSRESGGVVASAPVKLVSAQFDNFIVDSTSRATAVLRVPGVFFRSSVLPLSEIRRNLARDPRGASAYVLGVGRWTAASASGTYSSPTGISGPVAGITTAKRVTLTSASSDTYGYYILGAPTTGSPTAGALLPVTPGSPVTFSAYVRWTTAGVGAMSVIGRVRYSADGSTWQAAVATIDTIPVTAGVWQRVSFTVTPPAGALWMAAGFYSTGPSDRASGDTFDASALLIEYGSTLRSYLDGSYTSDVGEPSWTGTVNDSPSILSSSSELNFSADFESVAIPALDGSTAPITDPILRILGPVTNPVVRNPTSGTSIGYTGSVSAGQYLFIRLDNLSARISTTATYWMSGGTTVTANVTYNPRGILQLWPAISADPYTRPVLVSATGTGKTAATRLAIQAARSYL